MRRVMLTTMDSQISTVDNDGMFQEKYDEETDKRQTARNMRVYGASQFPAISVKTIIGTASVFSDMFMKTNDTLVKSISITIIVHYM